MPAQRVFSDTATTQLYESQGFKADIQAFQKSHVGFSAVV